MTVSSETLTSISTPERLDTRLGALDFVDGVPTGDTAERVYDHLDFVHGLNVYLDGFGDRRRTRSGRASTGRARTTTRSSSSRS